MSDILGSTNVLSSYIYDMNIYACGCMLFYCYPYAGLQLSIASHCRSRRFVFFLVCFFLRLHLQLILKTRLWLRLFQCPCFDFVISAALAILSLRAHQPVVGPRPTDLLSDPDPPTCCRTKTHRPVVRPRHTNLISEPDTPTCCQTQTHQPVVRHRHTNLLSDLDTPTCCQT